MNKITKFAVKYPVSVLMLTLAVCLLGIISYNRLGTDLFPDLKNPSLYIELQSGIFEAIQRAGGSLSHHHGVGRMIAPWMEEHLGKNELDVLKTLKNHFDPNGIMNVRRTKAYETKPR